MTTRILPRLSLLLFCCGLLFSYAPFASLHAPPVAHAQTVAPPQFLRDIPELRGRIAKGDAWTIGGGFLYWAQCNLLDPSKGYLRRWPLRGGMVRTIRSSSFCQTASWAADDSGFYYWNGSQIVRLVSAINAPFVEQPIAPSPQPTAPIIVTNGTEVWRDYLFWVANNTLYSAHRTNFNQLAPPEPLGANAHSLIFANNGYFYWFADGRLYRALKACLGFGGGACAKEPLAAEAGGNVAYATKRGATLGSSYSPLWTSGTTIRGIHCRPSGLGQTCSPGEAYRSPLGNTVGKLVVDGEFLFWVENRQDCSGQFCFWSNQGRLMRWNLPGFANDPEQIACCSTAYAIDVAPGQIMAADGWVYFDTSFGLSRLRRDAPPISADFAADSYEVTQGIQDLNNAVPLVADRPTFVRLYARKLRGQNAVSVGALLYGTSPTGAALPGSPLRPINGGQDSTANNATPNRLSTAGSWIFQLPASWTGKGTIQLRPLVDPENVWSDSDRSNNSLPARSFTFTAKAPICLVTIPVRTHAPAARYNDPSMARLIDMARQLMPTSEIWLYHQTNDVAQLEARVGIPPWKYEPYAVPEDGGNILNALRQRELLSDDPDACDDAGAFTHYVGLVHSQTPTNQNGSENLGLGRTPGSVLYIKQISPALLSSTTQDWKVQRFNTLGHELSHNYGRRHVNCGGPAKLDPSYPYVDGNGINCVLDDGRRNGNPIPAHQRYYGFDTKSLTPIDPGTTADYMTYSAPYWVSDYTWRGVFGGINTRALSVVPQAQQELAAAHEVVYLSGSIDPTANTGSLDHAWVFPANALTEGIRTKLATAAAPRATTSQSTEAYLLRLRDADGALLDERTVTLDATDDAETVTQGFTLTMPAPTGQVARIELVSGDTVIARLQPQGSAPVVSILSPTGGETIDNQLTLSWQAFDADEADRLLFTVQYSPDNGQHWRTLLTSFPNLSGTDMVTLDLTELGGLPASTSGGRIRVVASDGYNTTLATSQPFSVTNRAPEPQIIAPGNAPIPAGQPILLQGSATDAEEGGVPEESLLWAIDGEGIGTGSQRYISGLAPGSYTLTLTAADSTGTETIATTTLTVAPLVLPEAAEPTLDGTCDDATYTTAPQLSLRAYADGSAASVRLIRSSDALWACFVGMQRTGELSAGTVAGVRIDSDNSRDAQPQSGDYMFAIGEDGALTTYEGNGAAYTAQGQNGLRGQVSANDTSWMAELRIEASLLGGWDRMIGLSVEQVDVSAPADNHPWPHLATSDNPGSWAATALGEIARLSQIRPASAPVGSSDLQLTLSGEGFASGATVLWDGAPLPTTVISSTQVQATVAAAELAEAGERSITVANPGLAATPSNSQLFSILNPVPVITELTLTDTTLTVIGSSFVADATVIWNGIEHTPSGSALLAAELDHATQLTIELDHADLIAPGDLEVTVLNPGPGGGLSNVATLDSVEPLYTLYLPLQIRQGASDEGALLPVGHRGGHVRDGRAWR